MVLIKVIAVKKNEFPEQGQGGLYQTFTPKITKSWDPEVWLGQAYLGCTTVAAA